MAIQEGCRAGRKVGVRIKMIIYLATWLEDSQGESLSKSNGKHRLLSFYFIKEAKKGLFDLTQYVETGKIKPKRRDDEVPKKRVG